MNRSTDRAAKVRFLPDDGLFGLFTWPTLNTKEQESPSMETFYEAMVRNLALCDVWAQLDQMVNPSDFRAFGFSKI